MITKLSSRQAYVRDLEEKIKAYDETSLSSSESMTDLKREITRLKDAEAHSAKYIADLEARLARSDESVLALQQTVEGLEKECDRRREEVETLKTRLESFRQDGENWRSDLEEREARVKQLEEKMHEWEQKKKEAGDARIRLGEVVGEVESARKSLQLDISQVPSSISSSPPSDSAVPSPVKVNGENIPAPPGTSELENQLLALQETHTATLADLSSITAKYRDALREISDLAAQIQELKLSSPGVVETSSESPSSDKPHEPPTLTRRRMTNPRTRESPEVQLGSPGRRLFFRQAASAESLHAR